MTRSSRVEPAGWAWLLEHGLRAHTPANEAVAEEG